VEGFLRDAIKEVIENFEPRVLVKKVDALFDYDNNGYNVRIYFIVLNSSEPVVTTLFLERIR
jgi:predicted component of type VI protein secretion system